MVRPPRRRSGVGARVAAGQDGSRALHAHLREQPAIDVGHGAFPSPLRQERTAALLGIALGVAFLTCFATGLISHFAQHPIDLGLLSMPASPGWLYRLTQGLHVASGTAAIPLLLAKLWTVFPLLFTFPPVRSRAHLVERVALVPLVGGSLFQLFSGLANTTRWYPWKFSFTITHYWTAWIVIGALITHIAAKWLITRRSLGREAAAVDPAAGRPDGLSRRGFLGTVAAAVGVVTLTTVGQTVRSLRRLALLAPRRPDIGPQGLPVNKSAAGARVVAVAQDPQWALVVDGAVATPLRLSLGDLRAMPQHSADLPITCVEGWSAGARWTGVPIRELLARAGASPDAEVIVHSLQQRGTYSRSRLNMPHTRHPDTLLALAVGGEPLHLDHGFPARLIAPNRPGVQQTKWVARMEVL